MLYLKYLSHWSYHPNLWFSILTGSVLGQFKRLDCVPPPRSPPPHPAKFLPKPELGNVTLFSNRLFSDVVQIKVRSHWIRVGLKSNDWCPEKDMHTWRHRSDIHTKGRWPCEDTSRLEQFGDKPRNVKDCWQLPGAKKITRGNPSLESLEGMGPCWHLDFRLLGSKSVGE